MNGSISRIQAFMDDKKVDLAVVTSPRTIYYLTGYAGEPHERFLGLVLTRGGEPFMLVPELDLETVRSASRVQIVHTYSDTDNPYAVLTKRLAPSGADALGRIGIEKRAMSVERFEQLSGALQADEWIALDELLAEMRARKSSEEIGHLRRAARLTDQVLERVLPSIRPGVTELELAAELEYQMKKLGADGPSFTTTVLSGAKSALPHGATGNRKVASGEWLLIDMGLYVNGYVSDITRTFAVSDVTDEQRQLYELVLQANLQGIAAVRPQVRMMDVDRAARQVIEAGGYGPYFNHRVGHGIGMDIHEYPSLHGSNEERLAEGMAITIEPGVYIPGTGGVRIEDDLVVTAAGSEILTLFDKHLTIVG